MHILVVQTAFLGDVVLTTPLFRELKRVHADSTITLVTNDVGHRLLAASNWIDRFLVYDKRWSLPGLASFLGVVRELRRGRFDAAIAAQRSTRTGQLLVLSGAPTRIGYAGAAGAWAYPTRVPWDAGKHAARRYLDLSVPLGGDLRQADPAPGLTVDVEADREISERLATIPASDDRALRVIAPGSVWPTKRWRPEGFAAVVADADARGLLPVLVGSGQEKELCAHVARLAGVPCLDLAGSISIAQLVAVIARAETVVTNDSGPAHIGAAVGTRVVSVFGPTTSAMGFVAFGERTSVVELEGLDCRPCSRHGSKVCPQGHFRCMLDIPAERVIEALEQD